MGWVVDVVLLAAGVVAIIAGWRRGALLTGGAMAGLIVGLWLGLTLAPLVLDWVGALHGAGPYVRTFVAGAVVVVCTAVLYGLATTVMALVRRGVVRGAARGLDAVGGSLVALVAWAAVVWLVAGFLQSSSMLTLSEAASGSRVVQALDAVAPMRSAAVLGRLDEALDAAGFPEVFIGSEESIHPVEAPDPSVPAAVDRAGDSVVKVVASEPRCGTLSEGSGWVVAPHLVVTNAHVVAGASGLAVRPRHGGATLRGRLVAFDPDKDLAILDVPDLTASPLRHGGTLETGDQVYALGYPRGGSYQAAPARIRRHLDAEGRDIYHSAAVTREIYSLRATVLPGDSGGPLLDASGRVAGIVFARSTTNGDTGYALAVSELDGLLQNARSGASVSTGSCTDD